MLDKQDQSAQNADNESPGQIPSFAICGTNLGRVKIFRIGAFEADGAVVQICRTAGAVALPVVGAKLMTVQQLDMNSPVVNIDTLKDKVVV